MRDKIFYKPNLNFLPENLDIDKWLSNTKLYNFKKFSKDDCAVLISNLYTIPLHNKKLRQEENMRYRPYYSLSSKIMYGYTKEYKKYIDLFISSNIWETNNSYEVGKKSKGYRFTDEYYNKPCKKYLNFKYGSAIEEMEEEIAEDVLEGGATKTVQKLVNTLTSIGIDYNTAIEKLQQEYTDGMMTTSQRNCAYCAIEKINNGEFFAKQDEYGRLHTNLTNLKKEYRNYLIVNGEKLVSIDLKNSQPFFSTLLFDSDFWENKNVRGRLNIKDIYSNISNDNKHLDSIIMFTKSVAHNVDVIMYIDLVVNGTLYEFFLQRLIDEGVKVDTRADAKKKIFMVFFSELLHLENSKSASVFKRWFPSVYELFYLIKQNEHNNLALLLQAIESNVFIEKIPCKYWEKAGDSPIYTIHDSFMIPVENLEVLKEEMVNCLTLNVGYRPSVEIEYLD